ncbi:hypothetical protein B0T17DRAFT_124334 [Bombardia bombarda]|uniref:Uncharacterized protein n=1 Tax=Bombardia bombarda TaxID=252184 RepID=A0AA39WBI9_9PEZI|nr:hypothetical protein B0T17DRAFT_124334 [Bombardia bombarda]
MPAASGLYIHTGVRRASKISCSAPLSADVFICPFPLVLLGSLSSPRECQQSFPKVDTPEVEQIHCNVELPHPITKCIIWRVTLESPDLPFRASLIVGTFYDAEGRKLWETEIVIGQLNPPTLSPETGLVQPHSPSPSHLPREGRLSYLEENNPDSHESDCPAEVNYAINSLGGHYANEYYHDYPQSNLPPIWRPHTPGNGLNYPPSSQRGYYADPYPTSGWTCPVTPAQQPNASGSWAHRWTRERGWHYVFVPDDTDN